MSEATQQLFYFEVRVSKDDRLLYECLNEKESKTEAIRFADTLQEPVYVQKIWRDFVTANA